jgi:hypothetical protein
MMDISRLPDRIRPTALIAIGMALFIAARRRRREFTA